MKKSRKHPAAALALIMALTLLPMPAAALGEVCQIGTTQYMTLVAALSAAIDGDTIELLADINHTDTISVSGETITFDLNGFKLNVVSAGGNGLTVQNGGVLLTDTAGGGEFNVTGFSYGVYALENGVAQVTSAEATYAVAGFGVKAETGAEVDVTGGVTSAYRAVDASGAGCEVDIGGDVTGAGLAIFASGAGCKVNVVGGVYSTGPLGAHAHDGAEVVIGGDVAAPNGDGVSATGSGSYLKVYGSATAGGAADSQNSGAGAWDGGAVNVTGSVEGPGYGAYSDGENSVIIIGGDATGNGTYGSGAGAQDGGTVNVAGSVYGERWGAACYKGGGGGVMTTAVNVAGDAVATGAAGIGAEAAGVGTEITVDGEIQSPDVYIKVGTFEKAVGDVTLPTTKAGYSTYTDGAGVVWVKAPSYVCKIVGGLEYLTLDEALAAAVDNDTIELLDDINHTERIVIDGKAITFDLNGHDLNVDTDDDTGLWVHDNGRLFLTEAGGSFNVTGAHYGVYVTDAGSEATVSNAASPCGVYAGGGGEVTVTNDVQGGNCGVYAHGTGTSVTVLGNVTAEVYGAVAEYGQNSIFIEGIITAPTYIQVGDEFKDGSEASRRVPTLLPGYFTYSHSSGDNVVYVKAPGPVCQIGATEYVSLGDALFYAEDNDTIELLADITYPHMILIHGKTVTFDLNGHDLSVDTDQSTGLRVQDGGKVYLTEAGGDFSVTGGDHGVFATDAGSYAKVSNATSAGSYGVYARFGCEVEVTGDVQGGDCGVYAYGTGTSITVHGDVTAELFGAVAEAGTNSILIDGVITAPTYIQVGDEIKDGSEASRRVPTLLPGYFTYSNSSDDNVVYVKAPEPIYGIGVSPATVTFPAKTAGYGAQTPAVISVENTGNQPTGVITIELSGTNAGSFTLSKASIANIAVDGEDTFTVVPNTGLAAGDYTATITLTNANFGPSTVPLSFTVNSGGGSYEYYTITASAGIGGSISPSGSVAVPEGNSQTFTVTPNPGYRISKVLVDGESVGAVASYTFENVREAHAITAVFASLNPFSDVSESDWFYGDVLYVYAQGLMVGTSQNTFAPGGTLTRGMFVTVLHRLSGDGGGYDGAFTDVPPGAWYEAAVGWAAAKGIVGGVGGGRFAPEQEITREQMATMLYRYAQYKGYDVSAGEDLLSYKDAPAISDYAFQALRWACGAGLFQGDGQGNLNPLGSATRAEAAAVLRRFIENVAA